MLSFSGPFYRPSNAEPVPGRRHSSCSFYGIGSSMGLGESAGGGAKNLTLPDSLRRRMLSLTQTRQQRDDRSLVPSSLCKAPKTAYCCFGTAWCAHTSHTAISAKASLSRVERVSRSFLSIVSLSFKSPCGTGVWSPLTIRTSQSFIPGKQRKKQLDHP